MGVRDPKPNADRLNAHELRFLLSDPKDRDGVTVSPEKDAKTATLGRLEGIDEQVWQRPGMQPRRDDKAASHIRSETNTPPNAPRWEVSNK
jgi:hypothetical protein